MAGGLSELTAQAIGTPNAFNWPWFIELCVCGILAIFFLFYFNRLLATLLSYGIRAYTWHHYRVWVDIQALQISLLGGRIFFKGVRYHGENETIFIHNGYITWRYWFRNVRHVDLTLQEQDYKEKEEKTSSNITSDASDRSSQNLDEEIGVSKQHGEDAEARIAMFVTGVEWYIYNRTPLYDALLRDDDKQPSEGTDESSNDKTPTKAGSESLKAHLRSKFRKTHKSSDTSSTDGPSPTSVSEKAALSVEDQKNPLGRTITDITTEADEENDVTLFQSLLVQLLPVYIECSRAAISIGNEHTRAILVTTVEKAKGFINARGCGPNDLFRQVFEFDVKHPVVHMRPNPDFLGTQISVAEHTLTESDSNTAKRRWWQWHLNLQRRKRNTVRAFRNLVPGLQSSVESLHHDSGHPSERVSYMPFAGYDEGNEEWHGLSRYLDENDSDDHQAWSHIDYARFSTVVDCPSVQLTFYWDTPGRVKCNHLGSVQDGLRDPVNGVAPPAYGLDLTVRGGNINYGPWTDRLRAEIQSVFFPASYQSATPAQPLGIGEWRQSTNMVIRVDIEEQVTLRVPTRESSKDWRWRGRVTAVRDAAAIRKQRQKRHFRLRRGQKGLLGPDIRPFGWISISVAADSTVRYEMDLVASQQGYRNLLQLDLKETKAVSSVNHADLWRCAHQKLECDLSNPLVWNSQHVWSFNVQNESMDIYLLRDHMFLLTDLISDFTVGLKSNYMTFVPFEYKIGLRFDHWRLFLNANDFNIIDDPCDLDSNTFLMLGMQVLDANVDIPMNYFEAPQNSVHFKAHGKNLFLEISTPVWNTIHSFSADTNMGTLKWLDLAGSYNYNAGTSSALTDSLVMDIGGGSSKFTLQGFTIRYLMNIIENYFGEDLHFRTLEEYQSRLGADNILRPEEQHSTKKENDLDVILSIRAEESGAIMPANLYAREKNLNVDVMLIEADLRFINYYMDLQVSSSPIEVSIEKEIEEGNKKKRDVIPCQLYISTVSVFGHRLFGAPPTEPTYVCNWDFDVGTIGGECSTEFLRVLMGAAQSFAFTFQDAENALPVSRVLTVYDITFLRARVQAIEVWMLTDTARFMVETENITISFNDWAGQHFSQSVNASIPVITLAVVDSRSPQRRQDRNKQSAQTLACLRTSIQIVSIDKKAQFEQQKQLQQDHVRFHDLRTHRTICLLHDGDPPPLSTKETEWAQDPPANPVPDLPDPISSFFAATQPEAHRPRRCLQSSSASNRSIVSINTRQTTPDAQRQQDACIQVRSSQSHENSTNAGVKRASTVTGTGILASGDAGAAEASFSSPWIGPRFTQRKTRPDLTQLPSITLVPNNDGVSELGHSEAEQDYTDSDESIPHTAIHCSTPKGIRAFVSPQLVPAIVGLLQDLVPRTADSLLDIVQQSTIQNIKSLSMTDQGSKIDFALHIPAAALRLVNTEAITEQHSDTVADHYDITTSRVRLDGRVAPTVTRYTEGKTTGNTVLLQASIGNIELCIAENASIVGGHIAKVHAGVRNIELWLSYQDAVRSKLQLGSVDLSTGGSTVDRLSMLVERTRVMVTSIITSFEALDQAYPVRHLVYHLSLLNADVADPVFLSRPSYVLRSAAEHVRLAGSWKILSRFRQRLLTQSPQEKLDLVKHETCMFERQQDKARQQIVETIETWETWDRDHEACEPILAAIFGQRNDSTPALLSVLDLEIGLYIGQISLVLDPGPQQSELVLQSGDLNFAQKPVLKQKARQADKSVNQSTMRVQIWFADIALDLNWNLVELARSLVKQINLSATSTTAPKVQHQSTQDSLPGQLDLMVVAGTDFASTRIRTVNLSLDMAARSLQTSTIIQIADTGLLTSLLLASTTAHLKLASRYGKLFNWKLQTPSIYGSYQRSWLHSNNSDIARFAASCNRLRFDMKENVLTVLEVIETVIRDEVTTIQGVVAGIEQKTTATRTPDPKPTTLKLSDIHVAFFLNNYKLRFCLLPSLHYSVTGAVARTSIVPQLTSKYIFHIDVKKNKHTLIEPDRKQRGSNAVLNIPPISSTILLGITDEKIDVNARSALERVTIEADAVQACIEAAYKPRNMQCLKDCRKVIEKIQGSVTRMQATAGHHTEKPNIQPKSKRVVAYSGHAVLEGFDVNCSAPAVRDQDYRADLTFGIRETTLKIWNHKKGKQNLTAQPQFDVQVRQAFLGLYRSSKHTSRKYGRFSMGLRLKSSTQVGRDGDQSQNYHLRSEAIQLDLYTQTAALVIDMATFVQSRISELTTIEERRKIQPLRRLTLVNSEMKSVQVVQKDGSSESAHHSNMFDTTISLDFNHIQVRWIVIDGPESSSGRVPEDLVFSIRQIDLRTQRESSAKLTILDTQLQTVPKSHENPVTRTANSALLPEMVFNAAHFSTKKDRRFAFQAAGKALDLRLAADGILPISTIQRSLARAIADLRTGNTIQVESNSQETTSTPVTSFLGNKRLSSLLVDADFAGAVVRITPLAEVEESQRSSAFGLLKGPKRSKAGRYGQAVQNDGAEEAILRAPGIAVKVEYIDTGNAEPTLSTELKVAASSNTLAPSVVPLILEIYSCAKEIIGEGGSDVNKTDIKKPAQKYLNDATYTETDPTAILGRMKLNAGLWVQRQEFSLTCQPIARVSATARFDEIFITINTVEDREHERFFSIITTFNKLEASVQHVYSRESTASFELDSIVMSLMNSKHINARNGISAILNISPMKASLNAKQMQDFLLFREIWYPAELRQQSKPPTAPASSSEPQTYTMQKYHELAATAALPWHAVVSIQELKLEVDFGQSLGKSSFMVSKLWASSKKSSDWEQNLCVGFDRVGIDSSGRMSGFVEVKDFRARTSIRWPSTKKSEVRAPLVQGSVGFGHLRLKIAFDYQPFAVADVSSFEFLMYNVRPTEVGESDRLVGILKGGKVQLYCIAVAAAQALAIVQAFERLIQEKRDAFQDSIHELDRLLRRKSIFPSSATLPIIETETDNKGNAAKRGSHRLHTDVVLTLGVIDIGAFPNSFFDNQIVKVEAVDVQARFAVATINDRLRSGLGMTLGQVRVALASISRTNTKALGEVEIEDVIDRATSARGGTILKVPRLVASMQTWQEPQSYTVEYIFRSTFQGKVDVGWNYSRIRFIRGMWDNHSQALTHRLGKPLPFAPVKITAEPRRDGAQESGQEKITAVVNVPQSTKFQYVALEPPIIDTPQLRDMGEATPPLEWIGLHRDKLPNVTHSIIIVTLLEVAKEVEDAYTRILGSG